MSISFYKCVHADDELVMCTRLHNGAYAMSARINGTCHKMQYHGYHLTRALASFRADIKKIATA